jgi:RNA polymerase sigma factor (sigma-70 family)
VELFLRSDAHTGGGTGVSPEACYNHTSHRTRSHSERDSDAKSQSGVVCGTSLLTNRDILDELFQSGVIGLIWAIDRFDCSVYTNRLSTYAVPWIYQSVSRAWGAIRTTVHVPMAMAERRAPLPVSECSLDAPLPGKMGDERQQTMGDLIAWHDPDIDLRIVITNALSPLEATAIRGYFGIGMPRMDYTSLAQLLQVSKGDVARIIDTGIRRLTLVLVEEADVER